MIQVIDVVLALPDRIDFLLRKLCVKTKTSKGWKGLQILAFVSDEEPDLAAAAMYDTVGRKEWRRAGVREPMAIRPGMITDALFSTGGRGGGGGSGRKDGRKGSGPGGVHHDGGEDGYSSGDDGDGGAGGATRRRTHRDGTPSGKKKHRGKKKGRKSKSKSGRTGRRSRSPSASNESGLLALAGEVGSAASVAAPRSGAGSPASGGFSTTGPSGSAAAGTDQGRAKAKSKAKAKAKAKARGKGRGKGKARPSRITDGEGYDDDQSGRGDIGAEFTSSAGEESAGCPALGTRKAPRVTSWSDSGGSGSGRKRSLGGGVLDISVDDLVALESPVAAASAAGASTATASTLSSVGEAATGTADSTASRAPVAVPPPGRSGEDVSSPSGSDDGQTGADADPDTDLDDREAAASVGPEASSAEGGAPAIRLDRPPAYDDAMGGNAEDPADDGETDAADEPTRRRNGKAVVVDPLAGMEAPDSSDLAAAAIGSINATTFAPSENDSEATYATVARLTPRAVLTQLKGKHESLVSFADAPIRGRYLHLKFVRTRRTKTTCTISSVKLYGTDTGPVEGSWNNDRWSPAMDTALVFHAEVIVCCWFVCCLNLLGVVTVTVYQRGAKGVLPTCRCNVVLIQCSRAARLHLQAIRKQNNVALDDLELSALVPVAINEFPQLRGVDVESMRARFMVLKV